MVSHGVIVSLLKCVLVFFLAILPEYVEQVLGRKCVCTSKACKEARMDTCETKYSCYTELILTPREKFGENATTRGCTEGETPLLCETKSWRTRSKYTDNADRSSAPWTHMPWPRLKCCDTYDYCNADHHVNVSTWIREYENMGPMEATFDHSGTLDGISLNGDTMESLESNRGTKPRGPDSLDDRFENRVRPLHIAALILAIAAFISVLAACYVITRFLRSNPYTIGSVE